MTDDRSVSVTQTIAYAVWAAAAVMFGVAMATYFLEGGRLAVLIAEGACIVSAAAATLHVKHYGKQVCNVVRDRDQLSADIRNLRSR